METINNIIYELNGNAKTKALAKRIELARINDEQRWRKDIADTRRITAEKTMEGIELTERAWCSNCIARGNLVTIRDLCQKIGMKYRPSQKKFHSPEIQTINTCFRLACEALREATKTIPHEKVAVAENATATPTCEKSSHVGNATEILKYREIIREMLKCCSISVKCGNCGKDEDIYLIPKSLITKLESVIPQGA